MLKRYFFIMSQAMGDVSDDDEILASAGDAWLSMMSDVSQMVEQSLSPESKVITIIDLENPLPSAIPSLPPTAASLASSSASVSASASRPSPVKDDRYALWVEPTMEILGPVLAARGPQLAPVTGISGCTGLATEAKPLDLYGVDVVHEWTCDPDPYSFNFIMANGPRVKHHFCDFHSTSHGECFCFMHGAVCSTALPSTAVHKKLTAGTSCRPFSTARVGRMKLGTEDHHERDLWSAFLRHLVTDDLDEAWLENVMGLLLRESRSNPKSPLQGMLEQASVEAPMFSVRALFMRGSQFLFMSRRRVFIHFCHQRRGGAATQDRMVTYIQVERI